MAIKYQVLPRRNPQDITAPVKFYAAAKGDGETDLENLAKLISYQCTVTEADCYAVLISLEHNIAEELGRGRIVKLGRLGNFQIGLSSGGMTTAADVSSSSITKSRVLFRPGKKLRTLLNELSFRRAS